MSWQDSRAGDIAHLEGLRRRLVYGKMTRQEYMLADARYKMEKGFPLEDIQEYLIIEGMGK